jgi:hypothetical protein
MEEVAPPDEEVAPPDEEVAPPDEEPNAAEEVSSRPMYDLVLKHCHS